jgi:aminopeptidase N
VSDERNVTPYLAFHKVRAMELSRSMRTVQTPNQAAYDARYYALDLSPNLDTRVLWGTARMVATVTAGPITTLDLDFYANMAVDSVAVGGATATFTRAGNVLTLNLDHAYATGEAVDVRVRYHGTPAGGPFGAVFAFDSHAGHPLIWTLSEPFGARTWWPCKDYPEDKADSVDVRVTVPSGMITAGNGTRVSASDDGTTSITRWHEGYPIATYLVAISSFAYATVSDWYRPSPTDSMEIQFYLYPEDVAGASGVNSRVKGMIAAFAARFGPYPFLREKYGEAEFPWGGGMENQTITSLGTFLEYVVSHELMHQWWGDNVTCRDFHHVWLNEGFATFGEAIWAEAGGGLPAYHATMNGLRYLGPGTVWAPDENDVGRVFDGNLSYNKGAWVLHMLRHVVGDTTFFDAMRAYGQRFGGAAATTEDFRDVVEQVSGMDLGRFFQEWIYGEYYPSYRSGARALPVAGGGYDVEVIIEQTQGGQVFWMPVDVTITTASGPHAFVAADSLPSQSFTFHVPDAPLSVQLDGDGWVLCTIGAPLTAVGEAPPSLRLALSGPNPARAGASLSYWLPRESSARVSIFDVAGSRVRGWPAARLASGGHTLAWDGRDDAGHRVPPGVYTVCLDAAGERRTRRLVLIR